MLTLLGSFHYYYLSGFMNIGYVPTHIDYFSQPFLPTLHIWRAGNGAMGKLKLSVLPDNGSSPGPKGTGIRD